ncbi:ABC transporter ATP-binding protein [Streptomyces malaysiensis]|uniref:ABC transporter ATP-binding protein n=1 Tax=Streptomyces malaysiensis TaxID=92644 RepID=UPI0011CDEBE9|nr:ABC transporter ATP-binding protein [Streptomyces sp. DR7-3]MCM3806689.1 ABC transporter ATP-binding protein [Streptomyces sp. DR7-3]MCQ6246494.1 ABC transporter ATP-binding protein [Streptomyces malaysiensis]
MKSFTEVTGEATAPLLSVRDLCVTYRTDAGPVVALDRLSFDLRAGETLSIVGESGSGKSAASLAVMGLLPRNAVAAGSVRFRGQELLGLSDREMRTVRGRRIAMVFQDALAALNPMMTVGAQLAEAVSVHDPDISRAALRDRAVELLDVVGIPDPRTRAGQYPHELSGGMRQRVMIATGIANEPDVLIADEPTTALDVTVQAQVLDVLGRVQDRTKSAILLITHDLGVVAGLADRVLVLYCGRKMEEAPVEPLFYRSAHPYTRGLLAALPRIDRGTRRLAQIAGQPPSPTERPPGCPFQNRCPHAEDRCAESPLPVTVGEGHTAVCLRASEIASVTP